MVTNAVVVALGVALGVTCFRVAQGVVSARSATLATAIFVVFVLGEAVSGTHHGWSMLAVMGAVAVLSTSARRPSLVLYGTAGALLGLAAFFTQTHGMAALLAFAIFAVWQAHRAGPPAVGRLCVLFGSFGVALLVASSYFIVTVGIRPMWACLGLYVWAHVQGGAGLGLPEPLTRRSLRPLVPYLLIYAVVPTGYALALRRLLGERRAEHAGAPTRERALLLWVVGVALFVEVATYLSWIRLLFVSMPAIILLLWAIEGAGKSRLVFHGAAWIGVLVIAIGLVRSARHHHAFVVTLPAGHAATDAANREKLEWLELHTKQDNLAFFANRPSLYLPLHVRSPLFLDAAIASPQTTIELARRAILELQASRVEYVLWSRSLGEVGDRDGVEGIVMLRCYLRAHYHRARAFTDGDEAWVRDFACSGESPGPAEADRKPKRSSRIKRTARADLRYAGSPPLRRCGTRRPI